LLFFLGCPWKIGKKGKKSNILPELNDSAAFLSKNEFETKYLNPECFEPAPFEIQSKELT
jgi:hypothetical protein